MYNNILTEMENLPAARNGIIIIVRMKMEDVLWGKIVCGNVILAAL